MGTNAIGTALSDGHIVQLMASEHYCDACQELTCTASPIWHPFTGQIIGTLDVTGDYHLIRSFLTNSLVTSALEIKQQLQALLTSENNGRGQAVSCRNCSQLCSEGTPIYDRDE